MPRLADVVTQTFRSFRPDVLSERLFKDPLDNWWKNYQEKLEQAGSDGPVQIAFFITTFAAMGHVAKCDGSVKQVEIALASQLMDHLKLNAEQKQLAIRLFNEGKHSDFALDALLQRFYRQCEHRVSVLQIFVEMQLQMAYADHSLNERELKLIRRMCKRINIADTVFTRIDRRVRAEKKAYSQPVSAYTSKPMNMADACSLLDVNRRDSLQEIKQSYRRLMSQYHPDKLQARGASHAEMIEAQELVLDIKRAYELLSRSKKFR